MPSDPAAQPSPTFTNSPTLPHRRRQLIRRICVIEPCSDKDVLRSLEADYGVELVFSKDGEEYLDQLDQIIFMISSYDSAAGRRILAMKGSRVLSPVFVRSRFKNQKELVSPLPNRFAYCELLRDCIIVFDDISNPSRRHLADIAHSLGASVRQKPSPRMTHLITPSVRSCNYHAALSVGAKIVRPEFIDKVWRNRDNLQFDAADKDLLSEMSLRAFCGLRICFVGFDEKEVADMGSNVRRMNGEFVTDLASATHIVVNTKNTSDLSKTEHRTHQFLVSSEWFWNSVNLEGCAREEPYLLQQQLRSKKSSRIFSPLAAQASRRSRSSSALLNTSNASGLNQDSEDQYSTDDLEKLSSSPRRVDRRFQVCTEMYETEQNYLNSLRLLFTFKEDLEAEQEKRGCHLMSKADIATVFNKVKPIIAVHEKICDEIGERVTNWQPDTVIGEIWVKYEKELEKAYVPYTNSYDVIKATLENEDASNAKFHAFLKCQESKSDFKRNTVIDLLIRPIQRLPSVLLLLREVDKRTDSKAKDKASLAKAVKTINSVLSNANTKRAENEGYCSILEAYNQIENIPSVLISANRDLIREMTLYCLGGTDAYKHEAKRSIRVLLFNDTIELAKDRGAEVKRTGSGTMGTISRMSRQLSLNNLRSVGAERKRFKHIYHIPLISLKAIRWIEYGEPMEMCAISIHERSHTLGEEELWLAVPCEHAREAKDFLDEIAQTMFRYNGRDFAIVNVKTEGVDDELKNCLNKYLKGSTPSANMSFRGQESLSAMNITMREREFISTHRSSSLRKALSNSMSTLSKKFGLSSSNLREQQPSRPTLNIITEAETTKSPDLLSPPTAPFGSGGTESSASLYSPNSRISNSEIKKTPTTSKGSTIGRFFTTSFGGGRGSIKRRESSKENNEYNPNRVSTAF